MMSNNQPIEVAWWSAGITSAVTCYLAIKKNPNVKVIYIYIYI